MEKKEVKIARTYRLPEDTIEGIKKIKESFLKDGMEISSDSKVITYAISNSLGLCKSVDDGYLSVFLKEEEIKEILSWYDQSLEKKEKSTQSKNIAKKLRWSIE